MSTPDPTEIQRLRESEEKYRKMIERANDAIFAIDTANGTIVEVNPRAVELAGCPEHELIGRQILDLHPEEEREAAREAFDRVLRDGSCETRNLHLIRKDGERVAIDINASLVTCCGKSIVERICRDVTRPRALQQNMEVQLKEKTTQLVQSEKMAALGHLVAGVAHEINTPLGALKSNNDLFVRSVRRLHEILSADGVPDIVRNDPNIKKIIESIEGLNNVNRTALERIVTIVNSLRKFARVDTSDRDKVDVHDGLESTLTLVHHELKNRIEVHKDYGKLPPISCFPNQLNQVFMNILVNAGQAIEDKGDIYIKTYERNGNVVIEFRDTGTGITPEDLDRIFDPGFTTKGSGIGTGLGLSIVHQIVREAHNGDVEVESEAGKGATFRIILPIN